MKQSKWMYFASLLTVMVACNDTDQDEENPFQDNAPVGDATDTDQNDDVDGEQDVDEEDVGDKEDEEDDKGDEGEPYSHEKFQEDFCLIVESYLSSRCSSMAIALYQDCNDEAAVPDGFTYQEGAAIACIDNEWTCNNTTGIIEMPPACSQVLVPSE